MIIKAAAIAAISTLAASTVIAETYQKEDIAVMEMDILTHLSALDARRSGNRNVFRGLSSSDVKAWSYGVIPYHLHDNLTPSARQAVLAAINHWNSVSSITLVAKDQNTLTNNSDFVEFVDGPSCASWVGRQGGPQDLWVSSLCSTGSMIHEIGHAIGLLHEHTRADRDQYIKINWENVQDDKRFNFEINENFDKNYGAYDYGSIMHYGEYYFSANGQPTIQAINAPEGVAIGQRERTSSGDIQAVNDMYRTDLSLAANWVEGVGSRVVKLHVTNLGLNGAHHLVIDIEGDYQLEDASGSDGWECASALTFDGVRCNLSTLSSSATSNVTISFAQGIEATGFNPVLKSKTYDDNLANNSLTILNTDESDVDLGKAEDGSDSGSGGGGGFLGIMSLYMLVANARRRRTRQQSNDDTANSQ